MWKLTGWVEFENGSSDSMYITHTGSLAECRVKLSEFAVQCSHDDNVESYNFRLERTDAT